MKEKEGESRDRSNKVIRNLGIKEEEIGEAKGLRKIVPKKEEGEEKN